MIAEQFSTAVFMKKYVQANAESTQMHIADIMDGENACVVAPRQWGKTEVLVSYTMRALTIPQSKVIYLAQNEQLVEEYTEDRLIPYIKDMFGANGFSKNKERILIHSNGSRFYARNNGAQTRKGSMRGISLGCAGASVMLFDEAAYQSDIGFKKMRALGATLPVWIHMISTPDTQNKDGFFWYNFQENKNYRSVYITSRWKARGKRLVESERVPRHIESYLSERHTYALCKSLYQDMNYDEHMYKQEIECVLSNDDLGISINMHKQEFEMPFAEGARDITDFEMPFGDVEKWKQKR